MQLLFPFQQGELDGNCPPLSEPEDVNFWRTPSAVIDQVVECLGQKVECGCWIRVWEKVA